MRKKTYKKHKIVAESIVCQQPIRGALGAAMISHDYEYHWIMFLFYGNNYWERGVSSDLPEDYYDWVEQYCIEQDLASSSFIFKMMSHITTTERFPI